MRLSVAVELIRITNVKGLTKKVELGFAVFLEK
jgi:hypothetical protein